MPVGTVAAATEVTVWDKDRKLNIFVQNSVCNIWPMRIYPAISSWTLFMFSSPPSFLLLLQQSRTLWQAVMAVSLPQWALCLTRPQAAPVPARTPRLEAHGTLSPLWRNGLPIPSASWALMPEVERGKARSRCLGQMGGNQCWSFPTLKLSKGLWKCTITTPSSPLETQLVFKTDTQTHLRYWDMLY